MALSRITKVATGLTNQFAVNFALGYIEEAHVTARVGEEVDGLGAPVYRTITFLTPTLMEASGAIIPADTEVVFERTVPNDALLVNFNDGDQMTEANLDVMQMQLIMLMQQAVDGRFGPIASDFDMDGFRIKNVGDPIDDTDMVSLGWFKEQEDGAIVSAGQAAASATLAGTHATSAGSSAGVASTQAGIATTNATQTTADAVKTAADRVVTTADRAVTTADRAVTTADKAATAADRIQVAADRVVTTADKAATSADKLGTAADRVQTTADAASAAASVVGAVKATEVQAFTAPQSGVARTNIKAFGVVRRTIFTAAGTYTPHAKMLYAEFECMGGGGGGGAFDAAVSGGAGASGGGGGAGGYSKALYPLSSIGTAGIAVSVGAGGTGSSSTGNVGGTSAVTGFCAAYGGNGGASYGSGGKGGPGAGYGSGNSRTVRGEAGTSGLYSLVISGICGPKGGPTMWGACSDQPVLHQSNSGGGITAVGFGAGGGGAAGHNTSSAPWAGGAGAPGCVVITEYCSE